MISKVFTLFCREFGNVVNHAFLVLIFWAKYSVGAIFSAFCNYCRKVKYSTLKCIAEGLNVDKGVSFLRRKSIGLLIGR